MSQGTLDLEFQGRDGMFYKYRDFFGKNVRCTVPVDFYSDDWHDGMREKVYVGQVCSCHRGGICLQPPNRQQGISKDRGVCFPVTASMRLEVLDGKLSDY